MKKALFFSVWLGIIVFVAVMCFSVSLKNDWPLWYGLLLFCSTIGILLLGQFLWKTIRFRQRNKPPVEASKQSHIYDDVHVALVKKWKEGLRVLKKSNLQRLGNPLYVLPWYMMIGAPGSGKSTALARIGFFSPVCETNQKLADQETENIDWWYFDKAVVIDTAGRYIKNSPGNDNYAEWQKILGLLRRCRAKEGINGLVLTIQADRLLNQTAALDLIEEGKIIRLRIEQLIQALGKRFPIYVLVTQCDHIYGMQAWSQALPQEVLSQAMGYVGDASARAWPLTSTSDEAAFVDSTFHAVIERLNHLRLAMMHHQEHHHLDLLLFPNEFLSLQAPLKNFLSYALGSSAYLEAPFLRGIFFSSARQEGEARSTCLNDLVSTQTQPVLTKSLFLQEIFGHLLPTERNLSHFSTAVKNTRRRWRNWAISAALICALVVISYLSISFVNSLNMLNQMRTLYPRKPIFTGKISDDIETLEKQHSFIRWLETHEKKFLIAHLAFEHHIVDIETELKKNYVDHFRRYLEPELADAFDKKINIIFTQGSTENSADYIQSLVRKINLVQARIDGKSYEFLRDMPSFSEQVLPQMAPGVTLELAKRFNEMYVAVLAWQANDLPRLRRLEVMRGKLNKIAFNSNNLVWLIDWGNAQENIKGISVNDFWRIPLNTRGSVEISPAFTREGKKRIDMFIAEIRKSELNPIPLDEKTQIFNQWYSAEKIRIWNEFVLHFSQLSETLTDQQSERGKLLRLGDKESPYALLMKRIAFEFNDIPVETLPSWLALNKRLLSLSTQPTGIKSAQALSNISERIREIASNKEANIYAKAPNQLDAITDYQNYALTFSQALTSALASPGKATQLAAHFHAFTSDETTQSSLQNAYMHLAHLQRTLGGEKTEDSAIWNLLSAPLKQIIRYADMQASCTLQNEWESQVIGPTRFIADTTEFAGQLYGEGGNVWTFMKGHAKPYVRNNQNGYHAVETFGETVPFHPDFLPFINAASAYQSRQKIAKQKQSQGNKRIELEIQNTKQQLFSEHEQIESRISQLKKTSDKLRATLYPVRITGLRTDLNKGAKAHVVSTFLQVQCADTVFKLNNLNFSVAENVNWSPQTCGETTLSIRFPTFTLTKKYSHGFSAFLQDFKDGMHTFTLTDFPNEVAKLSAVNVQAIMVRYQFHGHHAIFKDKEISDATHQELIKANRAKDQMNATLRNFDENIFKNKIENIDPHFIALKIPNRIGQCWRGARDIAEK